MDTTHQWSPLFPHPRGMTRPSNLILHLPHTLQISHRLLRSDFSLTSQLPSYRNKGDLCAEVVAARRPHVYQYLDNSCRLVIAPLTEKCYLTLMGAAQMPLGGAAPAGTYSLSRKMNARSKLNFFEQAVVQKPNSFVELFEIPSRSCRAVIWHLP